MNTKRRNLLTLGAALVLALSATSCSDASQADLGGLFGEKEWDLAQNPRDVTTSTCKTEPKCAQAYETDQALYLKFRSSGDAEKAAAELGEGTARSRAIVVKFKDSSLTDDQRRQIFDVVDSTHRSN